MRTVPEFASGALLLKQCRVRRLRLREESGYWTGVYTLEITRVATGDCQQVQLQGALIPPADPTPEPSDGAYPFGHAQWRCYLAELHLSLATAPPESTLQTLPTLTDATAARAMLETAIRANGGPYAGYKIAACTPHIMRYKPGSRCTVLYELTYPADQAPQNRAWPAVVIAKTYRGSKGENAYAGMKKLWESPLGQSQTVAIAEPLAFLPEENVLVQGPIREEQTLKQLLERAWLQADPALDTQVAVYLRQAARGLAELHHSGAYHGEVVTWEAELDDILQRRARLTKPLPQLANLAEDLVQQWRALAAATPADPRLPAHRSFRPAQILLAQGEIGFIDFDGFCQAEPAMDLALFMTTLKNFGLKKLATPGATLESSPEDEDDDDEVEEDSPVDPATRLAQLEQLEALCTIFLAEYERHAPVNRQRLWLWESIDLLSLIMSSWSKIKLARLEHCIFMLERHLEKM